MLDCCTVRIVIHTYPTSSQMQSVVRLLYVAMSCNVNDLFSNLRSEARQGFGTFTTSSSVSLGISEGPGISVSQL